MQESRRIWLQDRLHIQQCLHAEPKLACSLTSVSVARLMQPIKKRKSKVALHCTADLYVCSLLQSLALYILLLIHLLFLIATGFACRVSDEPCPYLKATAGIWLKC